MKQGAPAVEPPGATAAEPVLDLDLLDELAGIGDEAFLARVVHDFIHETERSIAHLRAAFEAADFAGVRGHAHGICSGAANLGAKALHGLCSPWEGTSDAGLAHAEAAMLRALDAEWPRTRAALLQRAARASSAGPDPGGDGAHDPAHGPLTPPRDAPG